MTNSNPLKLSVILPNFNGAKHIETCLKSVLQQSYTNIEVLVVDAKSTDNSHKIFDEYVKTDQRVKHIVDSRDNCLSNAVNIGIENATGDYAVWIGGDDHFVDTEVFQDAVNYIKIYNETSNQNGVIFYGGYIINWIESGVQEKRSKRDLDYHLMWMTDAIMCGNVFFSVDFCKQYSIYLSPSYRYGMDYDLWLQMISKFSNRRQISCIPNRYIHSFTQSSQNITGGNMTASALEAMHIALKYSENNYAKKIGIYTFIGVQLIFQQVRNLILKIKAR